MIRRLAFGVVATLLIAAPARAASISFSDDFSGGVASGLWGNQLGGWTATGDVYRASAPSNSPTTFSLLPFDLLDFTVVVNVNNASDGGIWLRSDATRSNGLLLVIGGSSHTGTGFYFHEIVGGSFSSPVAAVSGLFAQHDEIIVEVRVLGDTYSVFLNGGAVPVTSHTWAAGPANGFVGLYDFGAIGAVQSFDNFVLRGETVEAAVPEPATFGMLGIGLLAAAALRSRRRR
jgi:hypothetical protein